MVSLPRRVAADLGPSPSDWPARDEKGPSSSVSCRTTLTGSTRRSLFAVELTPAGA